ncbi:G2/mitotic-specific cyclin-B3 [Zootermopsis nevadensis]|uniref:G2/mitotic-specific cyclin-B3 n=1 Tax=Zootermopsis nevadensis TaxID=136037 RepID=A0A067QUB1_ZOONE|nr:G2/mitotic-specific cyclin-B3 [Zootermopsis nevadensis]XP_021932626.1 G2/mitotic-specific cyclin-B3 [Zootermopsis nevadensis]KDR12607.1 G2/mitotic-specific cyclin-B3 [Zootermopsis nevadensis]
MWAQKINDHITAVVLKKGVITRSQNAANAGKNEKRRELLKRKAEGSPPKDKNLKRPAFGDITNAHGNNVSQDAKKLRKEVTTSKAVPKGKDNVAVTTKSTVFQPILKTLTTIKKMPVSTKPKVITIQKSEGIDTKLSTYPVLAGDIKEDINAVSETQQYSLSRNDISGDGSLYISALEDIPSDGLCSEGEPQVLAVTVPEPEPEASKPKGSPVSELPKDVVDFDKETLRDPFQVSLYAMDIFSYLKEREVLYKIDNYMERQQSITQWMRSLLVDWMVEVQENFELNHETLYLAVRLVDLYLTKIVVNKETLQLLGAAAVFIASKFDERSPPLVEDFLYICDGAYNRSELIKMEIDVLKAVDFNLGIPLSYRFLRRYARGAKISLPTLTLARYILELSLMEYSFVSESSSKLAAATLLLALKTKLLGGWTPALQYYSGYKLEDIKDLAHQLNAMLQKKPKAPLETVRNKYSHKIFFEVAKIPLLDKLDI